MKIILSLILIIAFISCNNVPSDVKLALEKAGRNRIELEKVINHYRKADIDNEKLKAAYFLIGNMPGKYGIYYSDYNFYSYIINAARLYVEKDSCPEFLDRYIRKCRADVTNIHSEPQLSKRYDLDIIQSDFLINNIDLAFQVWREFEWASHLSFNEFCEWILPYRIENEPLQYWRSYMFNHLSPLKDSVECWKDPKVIGYKINEHIANNFIFSNELGSMPKLGGIDIWNVNAGICDHRYLLITMAMRSMGIPVSIDFTFQYSHWPGNHSWTVLLDSDNKIKPFNGGEKTIIFTDPPVCPINPNEEVPVTSIYRHRFKINPSISTNKCDFKTNLANPLIQEVTGQYSGLPQGDIRIELKKSHIDDDVFLFSFGIGHNIVAVAQAKVKNHTAVFKNIGFRGIYFAGYITENGIVPDYQPFKWQDNSINFLTPNSSEKEMVTLFRKYPVTSPMSEFVEAMINATIEASDDHTFAQFDTIYCIKKPFEYFDEREVTNKNKYRYYRYKSSNMGPIRIASIKFYSNTDTEEIIEIKGIPFGSIADDNTCDDYIFENAFDGDIRTNFNAPINSWVALDLGRQYQLTSFSLLARNSQNIIEPFDHYELLYFNEGWRSLGKQQAQDYFLIYDNVPKGSLLLLRNLTKGREERIFMYKENEQVWL